MTNRQLDEEAIFHIARKLDDAADRSKYLDQICTGDQPLRERVEALLKVHEQEQEFLKSAPQPAVTTDCPAVTERPGTQIGPYKLLQQLGEGGFGVVYMAEQEKPVRRMVALKIIKPGMDTREVIARFESERQALAIMDHPNIAKVFDAGATETGRPYFVMELVKGVPITEFCDRNHMPAQQRLGLFVTACQAIQHAHHKGVIHRDIKPSNVMVTLHDGVPVVKVIDFGVAKATSQKLTEKTLFTAYGQMIGTPAYMSPEQAEMSGLDIDTRSDIYSLGVLLYELLTGTTPLDLKRLRTAGYAEMQRLIREEEAPRPSTRLSSLGGEATLLAGNRGTDPRRLAQLLAGDLDWIVMKALEKDRNRRYASPGSFAEDVDRFLRQEAISARPPSVIYKLRKFAQRNRVAVFLMLFVPATIFAVLSNHIVGLHRTRAQRDRAVAAERLASNRLVEVEKAIVEAKQALKQSETSRQQADALNKFLIQGVSSINTAQGPGPELLDQAVATLGNDFAGSPQHKADLLNAIGVTYLGLDQPAKAVQALENARAVRINVLGRDHPDTLDTTFNLASAYQAAGRLSEAMALHQETLQRRRATLGGDHEQTLASMTQLADAYKATGRPAEAIALHEESLKLRRAKLGEGHRDTLRSKLNLAVAQWIGGRRTEAAALLEETLKLQKANLGPDDLDTLECMHALTYWYAAVGRTDEAVSVGEETVKLRKAKLGPLHLKTLYSMDNLASAYQAAGRLSDAVTLYEQRLNLTKTRFGVDHMETINAMRPLGPAYQEAGRLGDSIAHREEIVALQRAKFGADHQETLFTMGRLAGAYQAAGRHADAVALLEQGLRLTKAKFGSDHAETVEAMRPLGQAYQAAGRLAESIAHREQLLPLMKSKYGPDHQETLVLMNNLTDAYRSAGRLADAISLGAETLPVTIDEYGADDLRSVRAMMYLAWAYRDSGRLTEAIPLWEEIFRVRKAKLGEGDINTINVMRNLGWAYRQVGRTADSLAIRANTLPLLKATPGADQSETLTFANNLAADYHQAGDYAKAEPLYREVLAEWRKQLAANESVAAKALPDSKARLSESISRLIELYDAWGKPDDAAKWRKELESIPESK